jgi:hypothetical protein
MAWHASLIVELLGGVVHPFAGPASSLTTTRTLPTAMATWKMRSIGEPRS